MDFLGFKLALVFCCCCRKKGWYISKELRYKAHKEATDRLAGEMDLLDLIKTGRITKFLSQFQIRRNQRQLVHYFRNYHIKDDNLHLPPVKPPKSVEQMLRSFDKNDKTDMRILYEITGRKPEDVDMSSKDSDEESDNPESDRLQLSQPLIRSSRDSENGFGSQIN